MALSKKYITVFAFFLSAGCYLFFALHSLTKIPLGDEVLQAALIDTKDFYAADAGLKLYAMLYHPMLYGEVLLFLAKIFSPHYITARVLGVFIFIGTALLIYGLAFEMNGEQRAAHKTGLLAVFLYCTHPMAIQGSLLLDRDNTFFTFFLALFLLLLLKYKKSGEKRYFYMCVPAAVLMMWAKLTPVPLVAAALLFYDVMKKEKRGFADIAILFLSSVIFAASWLVYYKFQTHGLPRTQIFWYLGECVRTRYRPAASGGGSVFDIVKTVYYAVLWFNPFFLCLCSFFVVDMLKTYVKVKTLAFRDIMAFTGGAFFFGHMLVGRLMFGFPKYHFPALFLFSLMAAYTLIAGGSLSRKNFMMTAFSCFCFVVLFRFSLDDVYRMSYFDVKRSILETGSVSHDVKMSIVRQWLLMFFPFAVLWCLLWKAGGSGAVKACKAALFVCCVALSFSQDIHQTRNDYATITNYGEQGTAHVIDYLSRHLKKGKIVLGSRQLLLYLRQLRIRQYNDPTFFSGRDYVLAELKNKNVQFFVYGVNTNTLEQVRGVFDSRAVQEHLVKHFVRRRIGTYTVWERKKS